MRQPLNLAWLRAIGTAATAVVMVLSWAQGSRAATALVPSSPSVAVSAAEALPIERTDAAPLAQVSALDGNFCPSDLRGAIATIISQPQFDTARWGIVIEPLDDADPLYQQGANTALIPASNTKLLTTAATLQIVQERNPQALGAMEERITIVNRDSHNGYADDLLRRIGGQSAVQRVLTPLGINVDSYEQADGSGLSRRNRATPDALVTLLKAMRIQAEAGDIFYRSLAVAGTSGTLRNRFRDTAVQGRLQGKTGTLNGVRALSGYLESSSYGTLVFSILINQPGQSGSVMLRAIDQIVLQAARVTPCN
ncbi:MAG: D-alanyl-D-alanine carboxypeptidase/D-alanyl-D-alanine-endopeptidase [Cyanobacteria bacterium]|nr:D-alanyl-D-alanine carboxypeptidase/D-alanyl-D-alanine-endopeptidase [Cyanobacteriota bacterium]